MSDFATMAGTERAALYTELQGLSDDQWSRMTVCDPWTVRHLVAHMTALANQTAPNFFKGLVTNGFSFDKFTAKDLVRYYQGTNADVLARYAQTLELTKTPPGPAYVALGEYVCHGEDIRRALGRTGTHPEEHVVALAEAYRKTGNPLGGKKRTAGLSLRATDADWRWGDGPEVAGPGVDLILAMSGRGDALDACAGEGVATLRSRC